MLPVLLALIQQLNGPATAPAAPAPDPTPVVARSFSGRARELSAQAPRLRESVTIDGTLSEPVWKQATVLTDFTSYSPVDGRPAQDNTEVRVWYAEDALYVAIRAWAPPGTVRATLAERDRIGSEDWVALHLDTFLDRRRSFVFAVNAYGVQADGMRSDVSAGPGVSRASLQAVDLSQDYVWQSKGQLLDDGFVVELRIPFKSIRYQMGNTQDWGVQVVRQTQRTGYQDTWAPTSRALQAFTPQSGFLRGLTGMKRGLVLDLTPTSVTSTTGAPAAGAAPESWRYGTRGEFGGDVRWGITSNFTVNATANPDFSQVETDVGQIPGDVRFALFFPELRPFFVEGSEQFDAPNRLVNTRAIVQPLGALKLTGKIPRTDVGLLSAIDAPTSGSDGTTSPRFNIVRLRRDLGEQSTAGIVFTDRSEGARFNRVAGFDTRLQFAKVYSADIRFAASMTRDSSTRTGSLWEVSHGRTGRGYGYRYNLQGFSPEFETQTGFVNRVDFVRAQVNQRFTMFGAKGGWWDQRQHFVSASSLWNYNGFASRDTPLEARVSLDNSMTIRGGWRVSVTPDLQRVAFDPRRYASYAVLGANGRDTLRFTPSGAQITSNTALAVNTPQWRKAGASLTATMGTEPEFFETSTVRRREVEAQVDLRPSSQVRVGALLRYQRFVRERDGSVFSTQVVPRLRLEYQFSRALFLRFIGQVESRDRTALRDPRTEQPLFRRSSTGALTAQGARKSFLGRADWLVSYLPSPGTVVFFGYGTAVDASDTMRPGDIERTSDGAFVKFSYLFRVRNSAP
ncbi:DUF5916 domain-containing protein [Gemmatimonas sp.]|jgi:hypothetical protein|uniref:DUF5916 domain-containing protein n=1 Tax=Gemmatimonas sp. TaxID=1962908 RepID=UPI0022C7B5AD|nr:DUF5916 domain-containing protein [Gemmatimonas sp.]MCZ8205799.1 DUF5916 domain-containing protein [Gemmatimonas sp.]